jgi:hypothetical protein
VVAGYFSSRNSRPGCSLPDAGTSMFGGGIEVARANTGPMPEMFKFESECPTHLGEEATQSVLVLLRP